MTLKKSKQYFQPRMHNKVSQTARKLGSAFGCSFTTFVSFAILRNEKLRNTLKLLLGWDAKIVRTLVSTLNTLLFSFILDHVKLRK